MGDFSVDRAPENCTKRVEERLNSMGFMATQDSVGSTRSFVEDPDQGVEDPSLLKTILGIASNVLMSSSSGRGGSESSRSVQVVILEEEVGTRLVIDASEPDLQQNLDEWVATELGGRVQD